MNIHLLKDARHTLGVMSAKGAIHNFTSMTDPCFMHQQFPCNLSPLCLSFYDMWRVWLLLLAVGEPPMIMAGAYIVAIEKAIEASRKSRGKDGFVELG